MSLPAATSTKKNRENLPNKIFGWKQHDQKVHRYHGETSTNPWIRMENHEILTTLPGHNFALARQIFKCLPKFFISFARSTTYASFYPDSFYGPQLFLAIKLREIEKNPLSGRVPPYLCEGYYFMKTPGVCSRKHWGTTACQTFG